MKSGNNIWGVSNLIVRGNEKSKTSGPHRHYAIKDEAMGGITDENAWEKSKSRTRIYLDREVREELTVD